MISTRHDECVEIPLGILCRCMELKNLANKMDVFSVGTLSPKLSKFNIEPIASGKVIWRMKKAERKQDIDEPIIIYSPEERGTIDEDIVDACWIPADVSLVSPKSIRPNDCYLRRTQRNGPSAEVSTLTDMLPQRGQFVRRRDIAWHIGSRKSSVPMSDEPESQFGKTEGCFSKWADAFTRLKSCPPY